VHSLLLYYWATKMMMMMMMMMMTPPCSVIAKLLTRNSWKKRYRIKRFFSESFREKKSAHFARKIHICHDTLRKGCQNATPPQGITGMNSVSTPGSGVHDEIYSIRSGSHLKYSKFNSTLLWSIICLFAKFHENLPITSRVILQTDRQRDKQTMIKTLPLSSCGKGTIMKINNTNLQKTIRPGESVFWTTM